MNIESIYWAVFAGIALTLVSLVGLWAQKRDRMRSRIQSILKVALSGEDEQMSIWERFRENLDLDLQRARFRLTPEEFLGIVLGAILAGFFIAWLVFRHLTPGARTVLSIVAAGVLGYAGPRIYVKYALHRRRARLIKQIPDMLTQLEQSISSGNTSLVAFQHAAEQLSDPMREELIQVLRDARVRSLAEALSVFKRRVDHQDLNLVVNALLIQEETGGSALPVLQGAQEAFAERLQVARAASVATSQGRMTAWVMGLIPFALLLTFSSIAPEMTAPLFNTRSGNIVLVIVAILYVVGITWLRRLLDVKRIAGE